MPFRHGPLCAADRRGVSRASRCGGRRECVGHGERSHSQLLSKLAGTETASGGWIASTGLSFSGAGRGLLVVLCSIVIEPSGSCLHNRERSFLKT